MLERVDQDDRVAAAGRDPARLVDHQLDRVVLGVGRGGEARRGGRLGPAADPFGDLLRADAGERHEQLDLLMRSQRTGEPAQRL